VVYFEGGCGCNLMYADLYLKNERGRKARDASLWFDDVD
jgi:hypothetical protein